MTNEKKAAATAKANLQDSRKAAVEQSAEAVEANSGLKAPSSGELAAAQVAATNKPHKAKGSSEYETPAEKKVDGTTGTH